MTITVDSRLTTDVAEIVFRPAELSRGWSADGAEMDDVPAWEGYLAVRYPIDLEGG